MSENGHPDWLPEEYDPDASLRERLPVIAEIEGGIELVAGDDQGDVRNVGPPKGLNAVTWEDGETLTLESGGKASQDHLWEFEIVVPAEGEPFVRSVDPEQGHEAYQRTKKTILDDIDVRIYGVDDDRLKERAVEA